MRYYIVILILIVSVLYSSCKKEEETASTYNNIAYAPSQIDQTFDIEVTVEANKVVEVLWKTGVTEFSKTTYRYTTDTIFETMYELGRKTFIRKHKLTAEAITSTIDSAFGRDTVLYYRIIDYLYIGDKMETMQIVHTDILEYTSKSNLLQYNYLYKNDNLFDVTYESSNPSDPNSCTDSYEYYNWETKLDVKNILGVSEGSTSKYLKSISKHLQHCNNNGVEGSTKYQYWYAINEDKYITELVYTKTFNSISQTFKEKYKYFFR